MLRGCRECEQVERRYGQTVIETGLGKPGQADSAYRARVSVLDPILASPYRPAARAKPHIEAGHTSAPDHMLTEGKIVLAFAGASTHVRYRPPYKAWPTLR